VAAGIRLVGAPVDLIVVHRDADNARHKARREEIESALTAAGISSDLVPIIPVRS
jgi:hypothetical protein